MILYVDNSGSIHVVYSTVTMQKSSKQPLADSLLKEIKKSRGSGGSLFIVLILAFMVIMGMGLIGGGTPSLRSTYRPQPVIPNTPPPAQQFDSSISAPPSPTISQ